MSLEDTLVENLIKSYGAKGVNVQRILDNQLFRDLPLTEKVRLIRKYEGDLSKDPKFNWSSIGTNALMGGATGALGMMIAQRIAHMSEHGIGPLAPAFKASPYGMVAAGVLGLGISAINSATANRADYTRDMVSQQNSKDALSMLISRYGSRQSAPLNQGANISRTFGMIPEIVGGAIGKAEAMATPEAVAAYMAERAQQNK